MSLELTSNYPQFGIGMDNGNGHSIYEFDQFRLDAGKLMLYRGGEEIQLPPKVIKTLSVLIESKGEILSKDELMARVWDDSIVEESNLSQYLYLLRKTLGAKTDGGNYIETLRRRGYRFNGEVRPFLPIRTNGSSSPKVIPTFNEIAVERHGNVLRLADWTPEKTDSPSPAVEATVSQPVEIINRRPVLLMAAIAVISTALLGVVVYLCIQKFAAVVAENKNEMSVVSLTNGGWPKSGAISRDGNFFAYTEADGEISRIWLQSTGQGSRIEIAASTENIFTSKTFSPDGRYIYYIAVSKTDANKMAMYRVAVIGGPSTKLVDGIVGVVSFSPDSAQIAFSSVIDKGGSTALVIADKDGGNQRILLSRPRASGLVGGPAWSPDGKLVAFAQIIPGEKGISDLRQIYTVNLSGENLKPISDEKWDTVYRIEWTSDGTGLIFIGTRENEAYSTKRDQVYYASFPGGASRRLTTSGIRHEPDSLGITKDNAVMAIAGNRSAQIWSLDPSGNSKTAVQISKGLYDGRAGLAPLRDGTIGYMAYGSDELGVWRMNGNGTGEKPLTTGLKNIEELRADPLGRYFVFSSGQERRAHLYRIDVDGANLKQLTFGDTFEVDSAISPDGKWIVYGSTDYNRKEGQTRLMKSTLDGGESAPVGVNECSRPHFSPDGRYLSCITDDDAEAWILSADDGRRVRTFKLPPYSLVNFGARWNPTSDSIVYIRTDKMFSNLWIQPIDGKDARQLTDFTSGIIYNYAFSPDGTRLFVARGYPVQDAILIKNAF